MEIFKKAAGVLKKNSRLFEFLSRFPHLSHFYVLLRPPGSHPLSPSFWNKNLSTSDWSKHTKLSGILVVVLNPCELQVTMIAKGIFTTMTAVSQSPFHVTGHLQIHFSLLFARNEKLTFLGHVENV